FLVRVIPKPSRVNYPCMKAAMPLASSFVAYIIGITGFTLFFRKARERLYQSKYLLAAVFVVLGLLAGAMALVNTDNVIIANAADLQGPQAVNEPIGVAKGIYPGRVVWVHDADATDENCANVTGDYWYSDANTNQAVVNEMLSDGLQQMTGAATDAAAWDKIFKYYNQNHGNGDVGYQDGEKIAIKINLNGINNFPQDKNINTSPQICYALLDQLVNVVGVAQTDISIGDPNCDMNNATYNKLNAAFPDVTYWGSGSGRTAAAKSATNVLHSSDNSANRFDDPLPQAFLDAAYLINIPVFKKHHRAGISLSTKNHFGSIGEYTSGAWHLHYSLPSPDATGESVNGQYGIYRCFVDIMGHKDLGDKTVLHLVDGIWGSTNWGHPPVKWRMTPFNNDWPNSLFLSQDQVALESVGYHFLYHEFDDAHPTEGLPATDNKGPFPRFEGTDDYLHQAADPANWPVGIQYDPEADGTVLGSLGTHEHWNNATDKKYSRNLGTGNGIELVLVEDGIVNVSSVIDSSGTDLPSNMVHTIYVDSSNVKWIGTDKGLARFADSTWAVYHKHDTLANGDVILLNSNIKDIEYERTAYGTELWMATDSGLTVTSYNVDGITSATTYHRGNSGLLRDTISNVAVDARHNRWIATDTAITIFRGAKWDTLFTLTDVDIIDFDVKDCEITDIQSYPPDEQAYIATAGRGIARVSYDDVDGFTGASGFGLPWSQITSNDIRAIAVKGDLQWVATSFGANRHTTNMAKEGWGKFALDSGLVDTNVIAVHIDDNDNVWLGTTAGLSVVKGAEVYNYTESEGLISNIINHITSDMKGNVWIATPAGIEYFSDVPGVIALKAPTLVSPYNDASEVAVPAALTWNSLTAATAYTLQVDTVYTFENPWLTIENIANAGYMLGDLKYEYQYFWRIAGTRNGETGPWSEVFNFITQEYVNNIPDVYTGIQNLTAYPNPVRNLLTVQGDCSLPQRIEVRIYTVSGQLVEMPLIFQADEGIFSIGIDVSDRARYASGLYIIQVRGETFEHKVKVRVN
ncbi:MAG: DUF362 domain-containing protein, partial [Bacteroidales bacterium]|nr:DUF362 domain-containing protein [Bacteroidales bacterium]